MSAQMAKQPNGLYCRYSFNIEEFTHTDMTEEDYIDFCCNRAKREALDVLENYLGDYDELYKRWEEYRNEEATIDEEVK